MLKSLKVFFGWLKQISAFSAYQPMLKLSHVAFSRRFGHEICVIQVIGKNAFAEFEAEYLINHPNILKAFAHEDVVTITKLAEEVKQNLQAKTCKIREIPYPNTEELIVIEEAGMSNFRAVTLSDISSDEGFLNRFKPRDAFQLGYIKANSDFVKEKQAIEQLKKQARLSQEKASSNVSYLNDSKSQ